jgi:hypothetical protein
VLTTRKGENRQAVPEAGTTSKEQIAAQRYAGDLASPVAVSRPRIRRNLQSMDASFSNLARGQVPFAVQFAGSRSLDTWNEFQCLAVPPGTPSIPIVPEERLVGATGLEDHVHDIAFGRRA